MDRHALAVQAIVLLPEVRTNRAKIMDIEDIMDQIARDAADKNYCALSSPI
jgi:hypothetical protein